MTLISKQLNKMSVIKAVLIDLSGTLHIDDQPTLNAVKSLERLRNYSNNYIEVRFITNTTKESSKTLYERLIHLGFKLNKNEIFSSLSSTVKYVELNKLNPFYLLSDDARTDFPEKNVEENDFNSVVVGLAPTKFNYENINMAFNILLSKKCPLIGIHEGKYYKSKDSMKVGPGCFIKGLEYSTSTKAIILGKPTKEFFLSAIPEGIKPNECIMIGDDPIDDIKGAMSIGMKGILVKTGKYLPNIIIEPSPTVTVENFSHAVDWIEKNFNL